MLTLFQSQDNISNNPLNDRRVAYIGDFAMGNRILSKKLKEWGAEVNNSITKATNLVIIGENPNPKKLEKLETLMHDGFTVRKLTEKEVVKIFNGEDWENYTTEKEVVKDLDFTIEHYNQHHYTFDEGIKNKIARKELYFCEGFRKDKYAIEQITGNLAAWGNYMLSPQIEIFVLSNATIEKLKRGEKDENIIMIQNYYNANKNEKFNALFYYFRNSLYISNNNIFFKILV